MERRGYILLDRNIQDWPAWKKRPFDPAHAFIDLLLQAAFAKHKVMFAGKVVELERGQLVTSLRILGETWGWSTKKVSRWIKLWTISGSLVSSSRKRSGTLVTICEYERYQDPTRVKETPKETVRKQSGNSEETGDNTSNAGNAGQWSAQHDYLNDWNNIADQLQLSRIQSLTPARTTNLKVRESEGFGDAWPTVLAELPQAMNWINGFRGFCFDWLVKNANNWPKVAEGKYRDRGPQPRDDGQPSLGDLITG